MVDGGRRVGVTHAFEPGPEPIQLCDACDSARHPRPEGRPQRTARFTVGSIGLELILGVAVALFLNRAFLGQRLPRALLILPLALPTVVNVDGAGAVQRLSFITLPGIRPALLVALVRRTAEGLKVFDIIYVMTGGGPASSTETLSFMVYREACSFLKLGTAAADAFLTVALIMIFVGIYTRLLQSRGVA